MEAEFGWGRGALSGAAAERGLRPYGATGTALAAAQAAAVEKSQRVRIQEAMYVPSSGC